MNWFSMSFLSRCQRILALSSDSSPSLQALQLLQVGSKSPVPQIRDDTIPIKTLGISQRQPEYLSSLHPDQLTSCTFNWQRILFVILDMLAIFLDSDLATEKDLASTSHECEDVTEEIPANRIVSCYGFADDSLVQKLICF